MSILISSLKNEINFNHKINIYIHKKHLNPKQLKHLKNFHGERNADRALKKAIDFFVYREINKDEELFTQITYSYKLKETVEKLQYIESDYLKNKTDFYKIKIIFWHLIISINKAQKKENDSINSFREIENLLQYIIHYNLNAYYNLFPERRDY